MTTVANSAVSQLRFPGFEDEWQKTSLGKFAPEIKSGLAADQNSDGLGVKVTRIETISDRTINLDRIGFVKIDRDIEDFKLLPGDILFSNINSVSHIGKVAFVDRDYNLYQGMNLLRLRTGIRSDPQFLFQKLGSVRMIRYFQRICNQAVSQASINQTDLKKTPLLVPTLPEQRKIADFLTAVDGRIGQLSQKKALLEDYKKGVMQQLFTQALRFKDDHGNEFPDWEEKTLGDAVIVNPKTSDLPDSFIYIDLESVNAGVLHSPRRISKVDAPSRAQRLLKRGDILYQTVRPYQMNNFLFDLEGVHVASTGYAQLRASKTDARFIYHSLHLPRFVGDVMDRCTGTSYPAINSKDLSQIAIFIPTRPEQTKIANFLTALDRKIESVSQQITHTQTFKKGLLQQMFV